jgi:energy-coupling factor transporter transmembrane protein EcfT
LQLLQGTPLIVFSALCILLALSYCAKRCRLTLKRCRYLLFAIALVYGWATPGQYLWPSRYSPTIEGLAFGGLQAVRLIGVLAALQMLLWRLSSGQVFSGLYVLLRPLTYLGLNRQRWALRLSLTMRFSADFLSQADPLAWGTFVQRLAIAEQPCELQEVSILLESLSFFDLLLLGVLCVAVLSTVLMLH